MQLHVNFFTFQVDQMNDSVMLYLVGDFPGRIVILRNVPFSVPEYGIMSTRAGIMFYVF